MLGLLILVRQVYSELDKVSTNGGLNSSGCLLQLFTRVQI